MLHMENSELVAFNVSGQVYVSFFFPLLIKQWNHFQDDEVAIVVSLNFCMGLKSAKVFIFEHCKHQTNILNHLSFEQVVLHFETTFSQSESQCFNNLIQENI